MRVYNLKALLEIYERTNCEICGSLEWTEKIVVKHKGRTVDEINHLEESKLVKILFP